MPLRITDTRQSLGPVVPEVYIWISSFNQTGAWCIESRALAWCIESRAPRYCWLGTWEDSFSHSARIVEPKLKPSSVFVQLVWITWEVSARTCPGYRHIAFYRCPGCTDKWCSPGCSGKYKRDPARSTSCCCMEVEACTLLAHTCRQGSPARNGSWGSRSCDRHSTRAGSNPRRSSGTETKKKEQAFQSSFMIILMFITQKKNNNNNNKTKTNPQKQKQKTNKKPQTNKPKQKQTKTNKQTNKQKTPRVSTSFSGLVFSSATVLESSTLSAS